MVLRVLIADEPERMRRLADIMAGLGQTVVTAESAQEVVSRARSERPDLILVGRTRLNPPLLRAIRASRSSVPAVLLDSNPVGGENLCLDMASESEWGSVLEAALRRHARHRRLRSHSSALAERSSELHRMNQQLRDANRRLNLIHESTKRLFAFSQEEKVLNEILQTVSRYNGAQPAVIMVGRRNGLAPRMGVSVQSEHLATGTLLCEPKSWQALRPFDTFLAEYPVENALSKILGTETYYYLPLAAYGKPHSLLVSAGKPEDADRAALRAYLPMAALALRNVRKSRELRVLAQRDSLTGLLNHAAFQKALRLELKRHQRFERPLSLVMLDIDHFKAVNDQHGHPAGDRVLKLLAELLTKSSRETDYVARYGGEEFVLALTDTDRCGAERKVTDILEYIRTLDWGVGALTLSAGIASFPEDGHGAAALIEAADRALYAAKNGGRDRAITYAEWLEDTLARSESESK
jgi:diguanylate cyclase (GGDEF)-like protein